MKYKLKGRQLTLYDFLFSLSDLLKSNRLVLLDDFLPWSEIVRVYIKKLNNFIIGASNKAARLIVGLSIFEHKICLSDLAIICIMRKYNYMQYVFGLSEFTDELVFAPSLVNIYKRIQIEELYVFTDELLILQEKKITSDFYKRTNSDSENDFNDRDSFQNNQSWDHKGGMKIDAFCCDAEVRYHSDIHLLNDASRVLNRCIYKICNKLFLACPITFTKDSSKPIWKLSNIRKKARRWQVTVSLNRIFCIFQPYSVL